MGSKKNKKYVINLDVSKIRNNGSKIIQLNLKSRGDNNISNNSSENNKEKKSRNLLIHGFFGWENFKWVFREFWKIYSDEPSFFSKKRFESTIGFIIGQAGMIVYLYHNYQVITMSEFLLWAGAEFLIAGYYVNQIQKEKKENKSDYYIDEEDFYKYGSDEDYNGNNDNVEDTEGDLPRNL